MIPDIPDVFALILLAFTILGGSVYYGNTKEES